MKLFQRTAKNPEKAKNVAKAGNPKKAVPPKSAKKPEYPADSDCFEIPLGAKRRRPSLWWYLLPVGVTVFLWSLLFLYPPLGRRLYDMLLTFMGGIPMRLTVLFWAVLCVAAVSTVTLLVGIGYRALTAERHEKQEKMEREMFRMFMEPDVPTQEVRTDYRFDDIIGLEEIKDRLRLLIKMCKSPEELPKGLRVPRGILFEGAPGNGKTMLAGAFANECGMNFMAVNSTDLIESLVGGSEKRIREMFAKAKEQSPCVLFLDEFDAIGAARESGEGHSSPRCFNSMVNALLMQMDGISDAGNVIVIAATNNANGLDKALVRPGRFDLQLRIENPDKTAREGLFDLYLHDAKLAEDVSRDMLVAVTEGCCAAAVRNICNEARLSAFSRDSGIVSAEDFHAALLAAGTRGLRKKDRATEEVRHITAIHEAGHAIAVLHNSRKQLLRVSICGTTSGVGGVTESAFLDGKTVHTLQDMRNELVILYGGRMAEEELTGSCLNSSLGAAEDIRQATELARTYVCAAEAIDFDILPWGNEMLTEKMCRILQEAQEEARTCIRTHRAELEALVAELEEKDTVIYAVQKGAKLTVNNSTVEGDTATVA